MFKYAFSHILETLCISFLTSSWTSKINKNSILYCNQFEKFSVIIHFEIWIWFSLREKNYGVWLCNSKSYARAKWGYKIYKINCVTGNMFQSKVPSLSSSMFFLWSRNLHFKTGKKEHHCIVYMLQEMKALIINNWGICEIKIQS